MHLSNYDVGQSDRAIDYTEKVTRPPAKAAISQRSSFFALNV